MRWRYEDLETFLSVIETGSITATAVAMSLSKSVVSENLDLEAALGTALFRRSPGRIEPTEAAQAFFERAGPLVRELRQVAESASWGLRGLTGRLRVSAPMSFGTLYLNPLIASFAREHPDLELAVDYDDRTVDLMRSGYDVAIRIGIPQDSSLIARKLCTDRRIICASPDYLRRRGTPASLPELGDFDVIGYSQSLANPIWQFVDPAEAGHVVTLTPPCRIVANNGELMRDLAIAGLGVVLLPRFIVAEAVEAGTLVPVLEQAIPVPLSISALYPPARPVPPKTRAFIDHLAEGLGSAPALSMAVRATNSADAEEASD